MSLGRTLRGVTSVLVLVAAGIFAAVAVLPARPSYAITNAEKIIPTPQQATYTETFLTLHDGSAFSGAIVVGRRAPQSEQDGAFLLRDVISRLTGAEIPIINDDQSYAGYPVILSVGTAGSNSLNSSLLSTNSMAIPDNAEGYAIENVVNGSQSVFVIAGREAVGSYYGSTSLAQMIVKNGGVTQVRVVSVRDYPDLKIRAVKDIDNPEGHFTYADDMEWMKFLSKLKINVFSLCYSHLTTSGWRNPPADYLRAVRDLGNYERDHGTISMMQELNPGFTGGLPTNSAEEAQLVSLYRTSLDQGGTKTMLAFDDQGSTTPASHRDLANRIYDSLDGSDGFYLTTVPQPYNFGYANIASYLNAYTNGLNPNISAVWTGDTVFSHYTTPANESTWRSYTTNPPKNPFYWHNDPNLMNTRLNAAPSYTPNSYYFTDGNIPFKGVNLAGGYIWNNMQAYTANGVVENIFRELTQHKIYAISLADWMWNPDAYENTADEFNRAKRYWDTIVANPGLNHTASASSQFSAAYAPTLAVDGLSSHDVTENTWASANGQPTAGQWWKVDLGTKQTVNGLSVKYREYNHAAYMVPRNVTIQVSDDNTTWSTVVAQATNVPTEGAAYNSVPYQYHFNASGRYVRLLFSDGGQNVLIELSEVDVLKETSPVPSGQLNMALNQTAAASSVLDASHPASKAADGATSSTTVDNSWASSTTTSNAWWSVDLGGRTDVHGVDVRFQQSSGLASMVPRSVTFQVSDNNSTWTTVLGKDTNVPLEASAYSSGATAYHYDVRGTGRYLRLLFEDGSQGSRIELSEVTVNTDDLALRKPAAASSATSGYGASLANDGYTARTSTSNAWATVSGTPTAGSWWSVDLGQSIPFRTVKLAYREFPTGAAYMAPTTVTIQTSDDNTNWTTRVARSTNLPANGSLYTSQAYDYPVDATARYVRVLFSDGGADTLIELSEVEVTDTEVSEHQRHSRDLAYLKKANASSTFGPLYVAARANDGLRSFEATENTWSTASGQPTTNAWWSVDLGASTAISLLRVRYREWPLGVAYMVPVTLTIQVSNDNATWQTVVSRSTNVPAEGAAYSSIPYSYPLSTSGRYVRVLFEDGGNGTLVELSEVEVFN